MVKLEKEARPTEWRIEKDICHFPSIRSLNPYRSDWTILLHNLSLLQPPDLKRGKLRPKIT